MNRFAALLDQSVGNPDSEAGPAPSRAAARRLEASLTRRHGPTDITVTDGAMLLQAGPGGARRQGPLTLVGDLGLTDLPALRRDLSLGPDADACDLVLAAWLRWGEAAPDHLHGAFAFLVHDRRSGQVTAVRDRFGVRPLAYAAAAGRLVIAQDLATVQAGLDAESPIDRAWVADFLGGRLTSPDGTAFAAVRRLPAGHLLIATPGGGAPRVRAWYRLDRQAPRDVGADRPQALRAALAHATAEACAQAPAATMLSGGLDSSSLALLSVGDGAAPPVPRPALSLRYADPALDEGPFIDAVLDRAGGTLAPMPLPGEVDAATLFDLDPLLDEQDQPVFAPGMPGNRTLYRAVRAAGCRAVLDGHGGDEIIGGDFSDVGWLVDAGRWGEALRLARDYARFTGSSQREAVGLLLAWRGRRGFGRLGRWLAPEARAGDPTAWRSLVDPALAAETDLVERVRAQHEAVLADTAADETGLPPWVAQHMALLSAPAIAAGFEVLDRSARAAGVVPLYPFYDHRVVELCVWQPGLERIAAGQPRALLRRAMQGVLPEPVRLRRDKTNFLVDFWAALQQDPAGRMAALRTGPGVLEGWVDPATLRRDLERLGSGAAPDPQTAFRLWRAVWLAAWLERRADPPADSGAGMGAQASARAPTGRPAARSGRASNSSPSASPAVRTAAALPQEPVPGSAREPADSGAGQAAPAHLEPTLGPSRGAGPGATEGPRPGPGRGTGTGAAEPASQPPLSSGSSSPGSATDPSARARRRVARS